MPNKQLSEEKRRQMLQVYTETECVEAVVRRCRVSPTTVRRYRKSEKWDERLAKVKRKAMEKEDRQLSRQLERRIKIKDAALSALVKMLRGAVVTTCPQCGHEYEIQIPGIKGSLSDVDKLIRLDQELEKEGKSAEPDTLVVRHIRAKDDTNAD